MKLKLDENMPQRAAEMLRHAGHDACTVWDQGLSGIADSDLLNRLVIERRGLITLDMDFSDIRLYPPVEHEGIIVLRPESMDLASILSLVARMAMLLSVENVAHRLWIVDTKRVRIRE